MFEEMEIDGWCVLYYDVPKIHLCPIVLEFIKDQFDTFVNRSISLLKN